MKIINWVRSLFARRYFRKAVIKAPAHWTEDDQARFKQHWEEQLRHDNKPKVH